LDIFNKQCVSLDHTFSLVQSWVTFLSYRFQSVFTFLLFRVCSI
jgi:hypothetical protein